MRISVQHPGEATIAVYDLLGREVKPTVTAWLSAGEPEFVVPTGDLRSGVYVVRVEGAGLSQARSFVVAR